MSKLSASRLLLPMIARRSGLSLPKPPIM